jgi:hypothetical protein
MKFEFDKKLTDQNIDKFINALYLNFKSNPNDSYQFDLTAVEYIGNQELLVLSAIFKSFIASNVEFEVEFFKRGMPTNQIPDRVKKQIIQFWEVWKIWKIVPDQDYKKYFDIDGNAVQRLQNELNYFPKLSELYTRHGVTPFICLNFINNYDEIEIQRLIKPIYKLNSVIESLLRTNKCSHPFTSNALSTIITEELYLNFLDHSSSPSLKGFPPFAFMSIAFQAKLENENHPLQIQYTKKLNFETESLKEAINFYYDKSKRQFKNIPFIQFSFLDFGEGIAGTLAQQYLKEHPKAKKEVSDSEVLKYAFKYNSSRHPISYSSQVERLIPRGLFDVLVIVRRYRGLLIVRSNYGKILFDFSNTDSLEGAISTFGKDDEYFPGTLISLYIPAIEDYSLLNTSTIKPELIFSSQKPLKKQVISIRSLIDKPIPKNQLYSAILGKLKSILSNSEPTLTAISFKNVEEIENRVLKKILYFLLTDYEINKNTNVLVMSFPHQNIIEEVESEVLTLNEAIKNYKIHPLPIINFSEQSNEIKVKWLGIYNTDDEIKLGDLLYEQFSLARSDFKDPNNISGQLNEFDSNGNLLSRFPNKEELSLFYKELEFDIQTREIDDLLKKYSCLKSSGDHHIFLCNGNYYQREFLELNSLLNNKDSCKKISKLLYEKLENDVDSVHEYIFVSVTTNSQKILKSLVVEDLISHDRYISLDTHDNFERDLARDIVKPNGKYILVCDILSTGFLVKKLNDKFLKLNSQIEHIAVIVSVIDQEFEMSRAFLSQFENKISSLLDYPIKKHLKNEIKEELKNKDIIRINPYTNIPITLSSSDSGFYDSIIFTTQVKYNEASKEISFDNEFLEYIGDEHIKVGYYKFNNLIHPYFFDTAAILQDLDEKILGNLFQKINSHDLQRERVKVFYPRKSGVENFDFDLLKKVLGNHGIEEVEIERFGTPEGWRFPHNIDYLTSHVENQICLLLDDGSCSGDSIIQMIDEISFYQAREIILLCVIGRVNDHKREFFSRLASIRIKNGEVIPLTIYFASHWHIPTYYIDDNPNTKEIQWLEELITLQNTPRSIKRIASNIKKEISPKTDPIFKDYKYLPKVTSDKSNRIPKKEILLIREELGRVIGYRLYKDSFTFFDYFVKKYDAKERTNDRYKEIELLCAALTFEPYLYQKLASVLPDVAEKIEEFIRILVFSEEIISDKLTYTWTKKDLVHLFFVVFRDDKLLTELTVENVKKLIAFSKPKEPSLNYVLYKLLWYFPLKANQLENKHFDIQIKELIRRLTVSGDVAGKEIKQFYYFISSLPSRNDFYSQLSLLNDNYKKQIEPEFHDEKISFNHNVSLFITTARECVSLIQNGKQIDNSKIIIIRSSWFEIQNFIAPILSFSLSYEDFLKPYPYFGLLKMVENVREIVGINEDIIFSIGVKFEDVEKLHTLIKNTTKIQANFEINSTFHKIIAKQHGDLKPFIERLERDINSITHRPVFNGVAFSEETKIYIPQHYLETLIEKELIVNLKNHCAKDSGSFVKLTCSIRNNTFVIRLSNKPSDNSPINSNGEGLKCMRLLADFPLFHFKYFFETSDSEFVQYLEFKLL